MEKTYIERMIFSVGKSAPSMNLHLADALEVVPTLVMILPIIYLVLPVLPLLVAVELHIATRRAVGVIAVVEALEGWTNDSPGVEDDVEDSLDLADARDDADAVDSADAMQ